MKSRSFLARAVLASTVFCLAPLNAQAAFAVIDAANTNTSAQGDGGAGAGFSANGGGYEFNTANNYIFTVNSGNGSNTVVSPNIIGYTSDANGINASFYAGGYTGSVVNITANTTFQGAVDALGVNDFITVNIEGAGITATFDGNFLKNSILNFGPGSSAASIAAIANGVTFSSTIDNTSGTADYGILNFAGASAVTGAVGTTNAIGTINLNGTTAGSNTVAFGSTVNAGTINLAGAGTSTGNGAAGTFAGAVTATSINLTGAYSAATFSAAVTSALNFGAANTIVTFGGAAHAFTGAITASTSGYGTLDVLGGGASFASAIGVAGTPIGIINFNTNASATTFSGAVYANTINLNVAATPTFASTVTATNINLAAAGTATFDAAVTGNINYTAAATTVLAAGVGVAGAIDNTSGTDNIGTLSFTSGAATITGNIGNTAALNTINIGTAAASTIGFDGNVNAQNIVFDGGYANVANIAAGKNIYGIITTTNGTGTINFAGATTISSTTNIGTNAAQFLAVDFNGGAGTVATVNNNIYAEAVSVPNGGTLYNSGSNNFSGNLTVGSGTLSLAANSPLFLGGTLSVGSTAASTIVLNMNSSTTSTSKISVTGAATLSNQAVTVSVLNPAYVSGSTNTYTLISATAASTYGSVAVNNSNSLLAQLSTATVGDNLNLIITNPAVASYAHHTNTTGVAAVFDNITSSSTATTGLLTSVINNLTFFPDQGSLNVALAELAPNVSGAHSQESFSIQQNTASVIGSRLNDVSKHLHTASIDGTGYAAGDEVMHENGSWLKLFGQHGNQNKRHGIDGYKSNTQGLALGYDTVLDDDWTIGASFAWSESKVNYKIASGGKSDINSYQVSVYGQYSFEDPIYIDWIASAAYNDYRNSRNVAFGNLFYTPTSRNHGFQYSGKAEAGYVFGDEALHTIPLVALNYSYLSLDSYTEDDAGTAAQQYAKKHFNLLEGTAGVKVVYDCPYGKKFIQPEAHVMANYDFVSDKFETTSQFVGGGPSFQTTGFKPARGSFDLGLGVAIFDSNNVSVAFSYDYSFRENYNANSGFIKLNYSW